MWADALMGKLEVFFYTMPAVLHPSATVHTLFVAIPCRGNDLVYTLVHRSMSEPWEIFGDIDTARRSLEDQS